MIRCYKLWEGSSVQSLSHIRLFATPWTAACQASLSFIISQSLLKLISIESVMSPNYFILCCPLLLLPSIFPNIRVFSNKSVLHMRWPKYWSFSFSISPSNEYSGLIFFGIDWFYLLAVQGTLKSLLQHHNSKAQLALSFLYSQLSHPSMTTGKTIALTRRTFVGKEMSLLFNMLSRLVITFLPRASIFEFHGCSHHLQWFWSPSKSVTVSIVSPSICHEVRGPDAMILVFWMLSFKPYFSLSSFIFIKRFFSFFLLSAIRVLSSVYLRLLTIFPAILIPAFASFKPAFHMMYSA